MGSHSVTWHPAEVTFQPLRQPKLVLDLATPEGCKRLSWPSWLVTYLCLAYVCSWRSKSRVDTVTGQLADAIGDFACLVFLFGSIWETASCPVRDLSSPRVGNPRVGVSASCPVTVDTPSGLATVDCSVTLCGIFWCAVRASNSLLRTVTLSTEWTTRRHRGQSSTYLMQTFNYKPRQTNTFHM